MNEKIEVLPDGTLKLKEPVELPEVLDFLIVGGGPGGTAAAFRAKELGISALVIDFDDLMKRIRDYAKDKLIYPDFGGGDKMKFPKGGKLIELLHFSPIDKDDMVALWKSYYRDNNIPAKIGVELTGLERADDLWLVKTWNHNTKSEETFRARHVALAMGRGVPRRFDIPGNTDGIAYRLDDAKNYVGAPVCVIGGGTSAAEAVIAISNAKAEAKDPTAVYWSYRGASMPKVSKALADVFFDAYVGNGNIRYYPRSEPAAVIVGEDRKEYLSIRVDRKIFPDRPNEVAYLEFPKEYCIACIGEDIPEAFLKSLGISMVTGGPNNKKRMVVTPNFETQQPNVYLIGAILAPAFFVTKNFDADPATFEEIKHRDNIKASLIDGVYVAEVIAQKLAGKEAIHVELQFEEASPKETPEKAVEKTIQKTMVMAVDKESPPPESLEPQRTSEEQVAYLVRILPGNIEENQYPIKLNGITTIGRKECDIIFPDDTTLSDQHASISHGPEGYFLRDDGSATGVFLRAAEGRSLEVLPGNLVRAGRQFLYFTQSNGKYQVIHYNQAGKEVQRFDLGEKTLVAGRAAPDIILDSKDMTLSRRHLAITVKEDKIFIKDLKSVNGTYLKVKNAVKLEHGDRFRVGQQVFVFTLKEDAVLDTGYFTTQPGSVLQPPVKEPVEEKEKIAKESKAPIVEQEPSATPEVEEPPQIKPGELAITIQGLGKTIPFKKGQTICEALEEHGIEIDAECHAGICGSDPIKIISGKENLNELGDDELEALEDICELDPKECRLACMVKPTGSVVIEILPNNS